MGMKALQSCKPPLRGATLIEDLQRQLHNPSFYDVIIVCDGKEFSAHKFILAARSPVFKGFNIKAHSDRLLGYYVARSFNVRSKPVRCITTFDLLRLSIYYDFRSITTFNHIVVYVCLCVCVTYN